MDMVPCGGGGGSWTVVVMGPDAFGHSSRMFAAEPSHFAENVSEREKVCVCM
jgi:hypothetical protein